ncbi:sigma-70 family RNA polymerase sigma factor [Gordonia sp. HY002]|uniref:sigma-70 family RNA polymerase sigma factor n=1 Tax=Gordonia zhenghanii TaxID=2911516 RepID=UPI001EF15EA8|nr:sigma-70 family RNA polymerase sigma factor [Gordonia zhenghanii]MCF8569917.1 sigma-70 family RNA polymerase sigma factor [Gordonia zhenghanii]MCF8605512.1 sigma-70 family RNA polymerase sigma factor [Gordonia zhenghanii]
MTEHDGLADTFDAERSRLTAVAYRMLGSRSDAEDAVQEAWLRLNRHDPSSIDDLAAWSTTVVSRICIDTLRSRAGRREVSIDHDFPEVVTRTDERSPEEEAVLADNVGTALLVVLETLRPDERLAFVLHDTFAVPFAEIASILDKSPDATKMLASRARRKVRGAPQTDGERHRQRDVVDAFLIAARTGDFEGLLRVLDPDVTWRKVTARGESVTIGADHVVETVRRGQQSRVLAERVLVDGQPGIMSWSPGGKPISVMACTVDDDRMVAITSILDQRRLADMTLPEPPVTD